MRAKIATPKRRSLPRLPQVLAMWRPCLFLAQREGLKIAKGVATSPEGDGNLAKIAKVALCIGGLANSVGAGPLSGKGWAASA